MCKGRRRLHRDKRYSNNFLLRISQTPIHVIRNANLVHDIQRFRELTFRPAPTLGRPPVLLRSPVRMPGR